MDNLDRVLLWGLLFPLSIMVWGLAIGFILKVVGVI